MKNVLFLISILFVMNPGGLEAQTNKGRILLSMSSMLNVTGVQSDLFSLGFTTSKDKGSGSNEEPIKSSSFNLFPKAGYFVTNDVVVGMDLSLLFSKETFTSGENNFTSKSSMIAAGPFLRYYIPSFKISPYFELGSLFGSTEYKTSSSLSPGSTHKGSITGIGGGAGIAAPVGNKAAIDILLGYKSVTLKDKDSNDNSKSIMGTFGLNVGFTVYLGGE